MHGGLGRLKVGGTPLWAASTVASLGSTASDWHSVLANTSPEGAVPRAGHTALIWPEDGCAWIGETFSLIWSRGPQVGRRVDGKQARIRAAKSTPRERV